MSEIGYKEANRRYRRLFFPTMIAYAALAIGLPLAIKAAYHDAPPQWVTAAAAILTSTPIFVVFFLMWRLLRETDEFTRMQQTSAMAAGGMITASIAAAWGFLELFDVVPKVGVFMLCPIFFGAYGLTYMLVFKGKCEPGFGA